jgi:hypothetical protein
VTNNKFHNNGFGEPMRGRGRRLRQAPYGDGFGVYHDSTVVNPGLRCKSRALTASASRTSPSPGTTTARTAGSTSSSILMVAGQTGGTYFGFGFCVFLRTERQEISRLSFTDEVCKKNRLGGYRLETDTDSTHVRSGDIREITWTNVQAIESQGDPTQGGIGASGAGAPHRRGQRQRRRHRPHHR